MMTEVHMAGGVEWMLVLVGLFVLVGLLALLFRHARPVAWLLTGGLVIVVLMAMFWVNVDSDSMSEVEFGHHAGTPPYDRRAGTTVDSARIESERPPAAVQSADRDTTSAPSSDDRSSDGRAAAHETVVIQLDAKRLARFKITVDDVVAMLNEHGTEITSLRMVDSVPTLTVSFDGPKRTAELPDLKISSGDDEHTLLLRDLATIVETRQPPPAPVARQPSTARGSHGHGGASDHGREIGGAGPRLIFVGLVLVLGLGALIIVIGVAAVRNGHALAFFGTLGGLALVAFVLAGAAFFWLVAPQTVAPPVEQTSSAEARNYATRSAPAAGDTTRRYETRPDPDPPHREWVPHRDPSPVSSSAAWPDTGDRLWPADVYSADTLAVEALAADLAGELIVQHRKQKPADHVVDVMVHGAVEPPLLDAARRGLKRRFDDQRVSLQLNIVTDRDSQLDASLEVARPTSGSVRPAPWSGRRAEAHGQLRLGLAVGGRSLILSTTYRHKPWVYDLAGYRSQATRQLNAAFGPMSVDRAEAEHDAIDAVATQLLEPVRSEIDRRHPGKTFRSRNEETILIRNTIAREMRAGWPMIDRFEQSFDRPHGRLYRQAVLFDTSPQTIARLADDVVSLRDREVASWLRQGGSVAGLLLLIGMVYAFLNAATQGYFTWGLRLTALLIAAGGVVVVFLLIA